MYFDSCVFAAFALVAPLPQISRNAVTSINPPLRALERAHMKRFLCDSIGWLLGFIHQRTNNAAAGYW